jgi:hypothetical protein
MLNDILLFSHIATRNNYFKITDHLADGKLPRNYDDTGNLFRTGDTTCCVTCWFVAVDFNKKSWKADACAYLKICHETGVPASLERLALGKRRSCLDILLQSGTSCIGQKARELYLDATMEWRYALGLDSWL